jgi:hypothetical protein
MGHREWVTMLYDFLADLLMQLMSAFPGPGVTHMGGGDLVNLLTLFESPLVGTGIYLASFHWVTANAISVKMHI